MTIKRDTVASLRAELEAYKKEVREIVIDVADEMERSASRLNELLDQIIVDFVDIPSSDDEFDASDAIADVLYKIQVPDGYHVVDVVIDLVERRN